MAGGQLQSRGASAWRRVGHHFAVAGFVALRRRKGRLAESAGKAARGIEWSQKYGRGEVDREWQIAVQGMADQVGGQQRDVVLPDDFCGLVQRQPLLADFVWGHGAFLFVLWVACRAC
ncbi:hypothetical protein DRM22_05880 [Salmonella enterica subsp. enterica serovar Glostrup]|nr:hypothetical protein [Salmonella enterica subsp. enterica serovar Glostrup]